MFPRALPCPNCGCGGCTCDPIPLTPQAESGEVTQVAGSWTFVGTTFDEAVQVSSSNAVLLHNTAMPADMETLFAEFLGGAANQDQLRFIVLYNSATDYWYAQTVPNASGSDGQLKLFQVSAGPTHTQRGSTDTIPGWDGSDLIHVQACVTTEGIKVRAFKEGDMPSPAAAEVAGVDYSASLTIAGTKLGVATGTIVGTASFYRITAERHKLDPDCACVGDCFPTGDEDSSCETLTECCTAEKGTLPASTFLTLTSGFLGAIECNGEPTTLADWEMPLFMDDCVDSINPNYTKTRRLWYEADEYISPTLCSDNIDIYGASFQCYSCLSPGPSEQPCGPFLGIGNANMYFFGTGAFTHHYVPMTILSCDPFYAESADGKIVLTE